MCKIYNIIHLKVQIDYNTDNKFTIKYISSAEKQYHPQFYLSAFENSGVRFKL